MPTCIKVQKLEIAHWTLPEDHQVRLLNLGTIENLHMVKLNATLVEPVATNTKTLLQEYTCIFAWIYTNLKGIPTQIVQHHIKLDTTIPPVH
jgi:hypothetical protein